MKRISDSPRISFVHTLTSPSPLWRRHILHVLERRLGRGSRWRDSELSRYHLRYDISFLACSSFMIRTSSPCPPSYEMSSSRLNALSILAGDLVPTEAASFFGACNLRRSVDSPRAVPIMPPGATMSGCRAELSSAEIRLPGCTAFWNARSYRARPLELLAFDVRVFHKGGKGPY